MRINFSFKEFNVGYATAIKIHNKTLTLHYNNIKKYSQPCSYTFNLGHTIKVQNLWE